MNENPLLAPEAKEKLITLIEEILHDFNYRLKSSTKVIAEQILEGKDQTDTNLIDITLSNSQFQLDAFVDQYIENDAPSVSTTIKFFEGNKTVNDATVTITLDSNYWDEEELEMCAFRLTADFEEVDPFKVKGTDGLSDKELEVLEKSSQVRQHVYDSLETIYDIDVYQMKISHIVTQD